MRYRRLLDLDELGLHALWHSARLERFGFLLQSRHDVVPSTAQRKFYPSSYRCSDTQLILPTDVFGPLGTVYPVSASIALFRESGL
jgi:hypothetical protein